MIEGQYNLQFEKLCDTLGLGKMIGPPKAIPGGLMHRMFAVQTERQKYAIKALNPQVMLRPEAKQNIINSERIAHCAAKSIPAAAANKYNGEALQEIDGQYYLIFDWIDGRSLPIHEVGIPHCEKIADILAQLHKTDFSKLGLTDTDMNEKSPINWAFYLKKGIENKAVWVDLLRDNINLLTGLNLRMIKASVLLSENTVITHGDLDPKNVMWRQDSPVLIDWEAAGFIHPMCDFFDTALYWSKDENENIDKDKLIAFKTAYVKSGGTLQANWDAVIDNSFSGQLYWLEYSLKRSLRIECADEAEQRMGTEHVTGTINAIKQYRDSIPLLRYWLTYLQ